MEYQNTKGPGQQQDKDMDLAALLSLINRGIKNIFLWIGKFFVFLFESLLLLLLFIKRKFVFLLIAAVIGFALGLFAYRNSGPLYYSDMLVRTNFESSRLLYNKIKYFNALIKENRKKELSQIFEIPEVEADKLRSFTIEPISDEIEKAKVYRDYFLTHDRSTNFSLDTMWSKTIKYNDFKKDLTTYDYPFHEIRLISSSATVFSKITNGVVKSVRENSTLITMKAATDSMLRQQEQIISSSLSSLDSLKNAYNKRITNSAASGKSEGQNFIFSDRDSRNPEIDIYDKELLLKDELASIKRKQIEQGDILQVYSDFNEVGTAFGLFRRPYVTMPAMALIAMFVILVAIEFVRGLNRIEKNRKGSKVAKESR